MMINPKKNNAARIAIKNVKYCDSPYADVRDPLDPDYQTTYDYEHEGEISYSSRTLIKRGRRGRTRCIAVLPKMTRPAYLQSRVGV
jgi:hypothetical protein